MSKVFASQGDLTGKKTRFTEVAGGLQAFTDEDDLNSGVFIGDDSVMIVAAQTTPTLARAAHDGMSDAESTALNARLVLVLANHIGDRAIMATALEAARSSNPSGDPS